MKKLSVLVVLFLFLTVSVFAAPIKFQIKNSTNSTAIGIFLVASDDETDDAGDNILRDDDVLVNGASITLSIDPGNARNSFDLYLATEDGKIYYKEGVALKNNQTIQFTTRDEYYYDEDDE